MHVRKPASAGFFVLLLALDEREWMRHIWIITAASLVAVSAWTTKPPRPDQLRRPAEDRLLAYRAPIDGNASITVTRDVGALMSACYMAVFIDGHVAAKLATGEAATSMCHPVSTSLAP
jgi:hypothetical protein